MRFLPQRRRNQFSSALGGMGIIVAAVLLTATSRSLGADSTAPNLPPGMAVTVAKSKSACFSDMLVVMGDVVPRSEILVRPDREGLQLTEILVKAGDSVSSGQVLAHLAPPNGQQGSAIPIGAPVGGIILAAPTVVGEMASARGEPLFRIIAEGDLELSAEVPAKQASRLSAGQVAKVKVAGMDESPGRVRLVSTTVDPTTQLGQVHISLEHNPLLRVGAFARATIGVGQSCGVAIPLSALLFGTEGPVVQVIRDNRIETRRVAVGLFAQSDVEIRQGLAEGDMIVVRAGAFLRDGDRVRPVVVGE
jgi:multidrug efflux pump subunit AcrA (membrane-fusion protein)